MAAATAMARILVIEDNDDLRHMFADALEVARYDVIQAADGVQALRQLDSNRPDLVVLDLGLPFFSGVEIRQELAANERTRHIPVVVVTGTPEDLPDGVPVECVLKKPVDPATLVATIQRCLARVRRG